MIREGYINKIIFTSEDTGYTVFSVETSDGDDVFVCSYPGIVEGMYVRAEGQYEHHPRYDIQFVCSEVELSMPDDLEGIKRFLASGIIKGVKEVMATRIIMKFKEDTLRIIEEDEESVGPIIDNPFQNDGDEEIE